MNVAVSLLARQISIELAAQDESIRNVESLDASGTRGGDEGHVPRYAGLIDNQRVRRGLLQCLRGCRQRLALDLHESLALIVLADGELRRRRVKPSPEASAQRR